MAGYGKEFSSDISKWIKKVDKNVDAFMLEFTQKLGEEVIKATPVDTGYLRASWTANIGSPDTSYKPDSIVNPEIISKLIGVKGGDTIYYNNNAGYGAYVEFGTSRMEPRNFVKNTLLKADSIARRAARKVNK